MRMMTSELADDVEGDWLAGNVYSDSVTRQLAPLLLLLLLPPCGVLALLQLSCAAAFAPDGIADGQTDGRTDGRTVDGAGCLCCAALGTVRREGRSSGDSPSARDVHLLPRAAPRRTFASLCLGAGVCAQHEPLD